MAGDAESKEEFKLTPNYQIPTDKLPTVEELDQRIEYRKHYPVFCFKNLDEKDRDFGIKKIRQTRDFHLLLAKLKMYSGLTWGQIEQCANYHACELEWHTMEKSQFPMGCGDFPPYEFAVSESFRIFGYHNQGKFFIVWFDPNHKMINMS